MAATDVSWRKSRDGIGNENSRENLENTHSTIGDKLSSAYQKATEKVGNALESAKDAAIDSYADGRHCLKEFLAGKQDVDPTKQPGTKQYEACQNQKNTAENDWDDIKDGPYHADVFDHSCLEKEGNISKKNIPEAPIISQIPE